MNLQTAIESYLKDCSIGLRPWTIRTYRFALRALAIYLSDHHHLRALSSVTPNHLREFLAWLKVHGGRREKPYSDCTVHSHYRSIKTFFGWCVAQDLVRTNPMLAVRRPTLPKPVPTFLSVDQLRQLLDYCLTTECPERNRALLMLMIDTGLRRAEVVQLMPDDVFLQEHVVVVRVGKMSKGRVVPLSSAARYELANWLVARPPEMETLFGMTGNAIYLLFQRMSRAAGLKVFPHAIRHTFATLYAGDVADLQQILGHADVSTTAMIYRHRTVKHLVPVHDARSPASQLTEN